MVSNAYEETTELLLKLQSHMTAKFVPVNGRQITDGLRNTLVNIGEMLPTFYKISNSRFSFYV